MGVLAFDRQRRFFYECIPYGSTALVDATQCESAKTIATDTGFCNVSKGDWIVKGENGETYVVDDTFFQRTFMPLQSYPWELKNARRP